MKKSDITIGEEYTYATYEWSGRQRVRVLGEAQITQGYGFRARTITGSRVVVLDSNGEAKQRDGKEWIINTPNRNLREPYGPWAKNQAEQKAWRDQAAVDLRDNREARSLVLYHLIPALREVGYEDEASGGIRDDKVTEALRVHVEDCVQEVDSVFGGKQDNLVAPLAARLVEYVATGAPVGIAAPDLLRLLSGRTVK